MAMAARRALRIESLAADVSYRVTPIPIPMLIDVRVVFFAESGSVSLVTWTLTCRRAAVARARSMGACAAWGLGLSTPQARGCFAADETRGTRREPEGTRCGMRDAGCGMRDAGCGTAPGQNSSRG